MRGSYSKPCSQLKFEPLILPVLHNLQVTQKCKQDSSPENPMAHDYGSEAQESQLETEIDDESDGVQLQLALGCYDGLIGEFSKQIEAYWEVTSMASRFLSAVHLAHFILCRILMPTLMMTFRELHLRAVWPAFGPCAATKVIQMLSLPNFLSFGNI